MCDYSLHLVASRPAKIADKLVTTKFNISTTRGLAEFGEPNVAVCVRPGTEIAFDDEVECYGSEYYDVLNNSLRHKLGQKIARFRQINLDNPRVHHDALEFPDGRIVLLNLLCEGQHATVLQLPAITAASAKVADELTPKSSEIYADGSRGRSAALMPMTFPLRPDDRV